MVRTISAPNKPEVAVICGAIYAGLNPKMVSARITRRCYGIDTNTPFVEGVDPMKLRRERIDGVWCANRFDAFVRKGQKVQVDECVTNSYSFTKLNSNSDYTIGIYAIDGDPPRYIADGGVSKLGVISIPNTFKSSDLLGHKVENTVNMYFGLNENKAEGLVQGKKYSTSVKFDGGDTY
ncbi:Heat shock 70 kDa protein 12A [Mortierella sp. AD094]|nr:Heat shock 70 kDa protein 12A [Mortierella sp. AD094]